MENGENLSKTYLQMGNHSRHLIHGNELENNNILSLLKAWKMLDNCHKTSKQTCMDLKCNFWSYDKWIFFNPFLTYKIILLDYQTKRHYFLAFKYKTITLLATHSCL